MVRTRFAPSPTGYMTIGNLRSALYEYLIAKHNNGTFILRIEDTDQNRHVEGATEVIFNTLKTVGITYDEGPGVGGDYGPYIQSERKDHYLGYAKKLVETGHAYYCFCPTRGKFSLERHESTDDDAQDSEASAAQDNKYDRRCLNLSEETIRQKLESGEPYVIRQKIPEGSTVFHDEVYGDITIQNDQMDDQILIKSDGMPTYNFANVVDDHTMAITHVVRGSEYLTSTPKYNLLYEAFGWDIPVYIHLPLMLNEHGAKISKRKGDSSIQDLIEQGFLPEAIINYIAFLGWSPTETDENNKIKEYYTLPELIAAFDVKNISKSPAKYDSAKLAWMNGEHIKRLSAEAFFEMAFPTLQEAVKTPGINLREVAEMTRTRIQFISDIKGLVDFIDTLPEYDPALFTHKKMKTDSVIALKSLKTILPVFEAENNWDNNNLYALAVSCAEKEGFKKSQILWPIRTALSGKETSPCGATELCVLLGKQEALNRLEKGIEKLSHLTEPCDV